MSDMTFRLLLCLAPFVGGALIIDMFLVWGASRVIRKMDEKDEINANAWVMRNSSSLPDRHLRCYVIYMTTLGRYGIAWWDGRRFTLPVSGGRVSPASMKWYAVADFRGLEVVAEPGGSRREGSGTQIMYQ